jgi:hypothetical protein
VDKLGLINLEGNSRSRLEVDWLFSAQETALLTQGAEYMRRYRARKAAERKIRAQAEHREPNIEAMLT